MREKEQARQASEQGRGSFVFDSLHTASELLLLLLSLQPFLAILLHLMRSV